MFKTLPPEFYALISSTIEELKTSSRIVDMCQIISKLQEHFSLDDINAEDILPRILSAARAQGVALKLTGSQSIISSSQASALRDSDFGMPAQLRAKIQ